MAGRVTSCALVPWPENSRSIEIKYLEPDLANSKYQHNYHYLTYLEERSSGAEPQVPVTPVLHPVPSPTAVSTDLHSHTQPLLFQREQ